jgi:hypothetical protein
VALFKEDCEFEVKDFLIENKKDNLLTIDG